MTVDAILFSRPYRTPDELGYLDEVLASGHGQGDGPFTQRAIDLIGAITGTHHSLLTPSGTHALELAFWLLDLEPGDEVVVPSFTFTSTAAAVVQVGAVPVFVDIDSRTGNIDPAAFAAAISPRTRAVCVVHYGGVGVDFDAITAVAEPHGIRIVEDNAHGLGASWRGRKLGTLGDVAAQSFHSTKNVHAGEGGALLTGSDEMADRAEVIREKGTDRTRFLRGQVDKYSWVDRGSSFLLSELNAAVLTGQLEHFEEIQARRHAVWDAYAAGLAGWAVESGWSLMHVPAEAEHPAHVFYVLAPDHAGQTDMLSHLRAHGINGTFHYVPLDTSVAGRRYGRTPFPCTATADFSSRLVRLPLWTGLTEAQIARVIETVQTYTPSATASRAS
ncbi:dTDP-4-amino-4,6-dideoxygalactose transaminase [Sanguibacter sp. A247]|uniref:dTDP-4-amino-4,6-dideoxygalactose transaminase n=1 Tax=unclassified Sanguibacter TaxID=2645534 RepID=UPI003FD82B58